MIRTENCHYETVQFAYIWATDVWAIWVSHLGLGLGGCVDGWKALETVVFLQLLQH